MRFRLSVLFWVACLAAAPPTFAQEGVAARAAAPATPCPTTGAPGTFLVTYVDAGKWCVVPPSDARITTRTSVRVRVQGLNHIRYGLQLDVTEEVSEAYQYLEKLWGSVLGGNLAGLLTLAPPPAQVATDTDAAKKKAADEEKLRTAIHALYAASVNLDRAVGVAVSPLTEVFVTTAQRDHLRVTSRPNVVSALTTTEAASRHLQTLIESEPDIFFLAQGKYAAVIKLVGDVHKAATDKTATFLALSTLVIEGEARGLGTKKAGTRVTVNVHAVNAGGAKTWIADLSYIVQSERPLVAHAGMSFGSLDEINFEKVRRVNGLSADDLFVQQDDSANTTDFLLFLGYQFATIDRSRLGESRDPQWSFFASLGTGIREPGKKIFIGPSAAFKRFVFTGGVVIGKEAEGVEQVQSENLFKAIREQNKAGGFFAFSVRVF